MRVPLITVRAHNAVLVNGAHAGGAVLKDMNLLHPADTILRMVTRAVAKQDLIAVQPRLRMFKISLMQSTKSLIIFPPLNPSSLNVAIIITHAHLAVGWVSHGVHAGGAMELKDMSLLRLVDTNWKMVMLAALKIRVKQLTRPRVNQLTRPRVHLHLRPLPSRPRDPPSIAKTSAASFTTSALNAVHQNAQPAKGNTH